MHYKYYADICSCPGKEVFLQMRNLEGEPVYNFPVIVYNVNGLALGVADNKERYITIWNSSNANRIKGVLSGLPGPFSFQLRLRKGQTPPAYVIGDTCALIVDFEGFFLVDADGNYLSSLCDVIPPIEPPITIGEFDGTFNNEFLIETLLLP